MSWGLLYSVLLRKIPRFGQFTGVCSGVQLGPQEKNPKKKEVTAAFCEKPKSEGN